jgi:hypothetical protein
VRRAIIVGLLLALASPALAQYHAEDSPHVSGQYGTAFWCVRQDTATALAANGDYIPCILNGSGQLWTAAVQSGSWTVTANAGSGTFIVGDGTGALTVDGTVALSTFPDNEPFNLNQVAGSAVATGNGTAAGSIRVSVASDSTGTVAATQSGTWNINNVSGTVSLPTGASTSANQSTEITSLQKIDNLAHAGSDVALSEHVPISGQLDDTGTTTVTENQVAPVRITSGRALHVAQQGTATVSGTVTANQGGTWTVQPGNTANTTPWLASIAEGGVTADVLDLTNNNPLTCAIVDGAGSQITSFGGGTQYVEDDAAAANPTGTVPILVRDDAPNTQTTTDGDNIAQRGTNYGAAYVQVVTSAGAFVDTFGGSGGTAQADRSSFTDGTTNQTPIGGVYNETNTNPTEDQAAAARITVERALHTNLRDHTADRGTAVLDTGSNDSLAVAIVDASGNQITSFGGGTQYAEDTALAAGEQVTMCGVIRDDTPSSLVDADGDRTELQVDGTGRLWVNGSGVTQPVSGTVTANAGSGTFVVGDGSGALNVIVDSGTLTANQGGAPWSVAGPAADGAAVSGNPVRIAGKDGSGNTQDIVTDTSGELQVDVLTLPSVTVGTFPDNEPFNLNQVAGSAVATGNGTASGSIRVSVASDSTGQIAVASLPNEGKQTAANSISVTTDSDTAPCSDASQVDSKVISTASSGNVELVAISGSTVVYVCGFNVIAGGTVNVQFINGTGTACATGETDETGAYPLTAQAGLAVPNAGHVQFKTDAGDALCVELSAAVQIDGLLTYVQR